MRRYATPGPSTAALVFVGALVMSAASLAACGGEAGSPEQRVRERITEAEEAAEEKDAGAIVAMLAEDYVGMGHALGGAASRGLGTAPSPQSRQSAAGAIHAVLAHYQNVHVLTRIAELAVEGDSTARATVFAAMSATPIAGPQALSSMEASLYRFDVVFESDGEGWFVTEATWRRAQAGDFL